MIEMSCFTVYDQAAKQYLEPFFAPTHEFAIRGFKSAVTNREHQFAKFPEDYVLYSIGTFDGTTGLFVASSPAKIAQALDFVPAASLRAVNDD